MLDKSRVKLAFPPSEELAIDQRKKSDTKTAKHQPVIDRKRSLLGLTFRRHPLLVAFLLLFMYDAGLEEIRGATKHPFE